MNKEQIQFQFTPSLKTCNYNISLNLLNVHNHIIVDDEDTIFTRLVKEVVIKLARV